MRLVIVLDTGPVGMIIKDLQSLNDQAHSGVRPPRLLLKCLDELTPAGLVLAGAIRLVKRHSVKQTVILRFQQARHLLGRTGHRKLAQHLVSNFFSHP